MMTIKSKEQRYRFETKRLLVTSWRNQITETAGEQDFAETVMKILTPTVTKGLPEEWQQIHSVDHAIAWVKNRAEESAFLTVQLRPDHEVVGLMFLYESNPADRQIDLRLGYLLAESAWGKGLGSELIKGLVEWCRNNSAIRSISGGVEVDNIGSIRVLEKNGFRRVSVNPQPAGMIFLELKFDR